MKKHKKQLLLGLLCAATLQLNGMHEVNAEETAPSNITSVNPTDFEQYFMPDPGGNQQMPSDIQSGTIILTPDLPHQVGGVTLKNKIGLDTAFEFRGKIGLGNKPINDGARNADGISIIFHTDDPGALGAVGANMGAGGLPNVTGFKFDTYINDKQEPVAGYQIGSYVPAKASYNVRLNYYLGWPADTPYKKGTGLGYGSFFETYYDSKKKYVEDESKRWPVRNIGSNQQQLLNTGTRYMYIDYTGLIVKYDPTKDNGTLSVTYEVGIDQSQSWSLSNVKKKYQDLGINAVSFSIQASTGYFYASQDLGFDNFTYHKVTGQVKIQNGEKIYDRNGIDFHNATVTTYDENGKPSNVSVDFEKDDFTYDGKQWNEITDVGTYTIKLSDKGKAKLSSNPNTQGVDFGDLDVPFGKYTIHKRPVTIQASNQTLSLDEAKKNPVPQKYEPVNDAVFRADFNEDKLTMAVHYAGSTPQTDLQTGQTYPKVYEPALGGDKLKNYTVTTINGDLTIPDGVFVTAAMKDAGKVYDGKPAVYPLDHISVTYPDDTGNPQALSVKFVHEDVRFYQPDETSITGEYPPKDVGDYLVKFSESGIAKIKEAAEKAGKHVGDLSDVSATYTITPRPVTITANDQTFTKKQVSQAGFTVANSYTISNDADHLFEKELASKEQPINVKLKDGTNPQALEEGKHLDLLVPDVDDSAFSNFKITEINGAVTITDEIENVNTGVKTQTPGMSALLVMAGMMFIGYAGRLVYKGKQ